MFTPEAIVLALVVALGAAALQGSLGFGFAAVGVPLLTIIDPRFTPVPVLIATLLLAGAATMREREHLDTTGVGWIVVGRIPGAIAGAWVLTTVARDTLGIIIALLVLAAVAAMARGLHIPLTRRNRIAAGLISGFTGTSAAIGGPPLALLYRSASGGMVRSSLGIIFTIGISVNLIVLSIAGAVRGDDFVAAAILIPGALVGFSLSTYVKHRFDAEVLRRSTLALAAVAATILLIKSIA